MKKTDERLFRLRQDITTAIVIDFYVNAFYIRVYNYSDHELQM